jgi:hypothetical protein
MNSYTTRRFNGGFQRAAAASAGIALTLSLCAAPVLADPLSGPEHGMDAPISQSSLEYAHNLAAAGGDSNHLFTWLSDVGFDYLFEIRGARVYPTGKLIEPDKNGFSLFAIPADAPAFEEMKPHVAYGGGSYLVTWILGGTIWASLVPAYGDLTGALMPESIALNASITGASGHDITFDSASMQFLVTWLEGSPPTVARGMRVSADGGALTPGSSFTIADLSSLKVSNEEPSVACADDGCLLTFGTSDGAEVYGAQVSGESPTPSLLLIGTNPLNPTQSSTGVPALPRAAFDGASYLVTWTRLSMAGGYSVVGARVDKSGTVLDPGGSLIADTAIWPAITARAGSPPLVTWLGATLPYGTVRASGIDTSGPPATIDPGGVLVHEHMNPLNFNLAPSLLAGDGSQGLIAYTDRLSSGAPDNIYVSSIKVSAGGLTATPIAETISKSWNHQTDPAVVWIDQTKNYLAFWKDSRGLLGSELAARTLINAVLSEDGQAISFHNLPLSYSVDSHANVVAAAGKGNVLVAWSEDFTSNGAGMSARVRAWLVSHDGKPISQKPIDVLEDVHLLSTWQSSNLSVMFDGSSYILVMPTYDKIFAARVGVSGALLEVTTIYTQKSVFDAPGSYLHLGRSAYGGAGEFLAVWADNGGVYCRPFSTAANTISASTEDPVKIAESASSLSVTYGSASYLAVWVDGLMSNTLVGTRLSPFCERLDAGLNIANADTILRNVRVVFDGTSYLVVWQDKLTTYSKWVSRDGYVPEQDRLTVAGEPGFVGRVNVASSGDGRSLVAYSRSHFTEAGPSGLTFDVPRARTRIVNNDCAFPSPIECKAEMPCFGSGECNPATKTCTAGLALPDGALCEDGLCIGGLCFEDPATPAGPAAGASGGAINNGPAGASGGCGCEAAGMEGASGASIGSLFAVLLAAFRGRRRRARRSLRAHAVHLEQ